MTIGKTTPKETARGDTGIDRVEELRDSGVRRILVALSTKEVRIESIDAVLDGSWPASGTTGSFVRLGAYLSEAGFDVDFSTPTLVDSKTMNAIPHDTAQAQSYDRVIAHQSHFKGGGYTFGQDTIVKSILWIQNDVQWRVVSAFFEQGGYHMVVPSDFTADRYRPLRHWDTRVSVIPNSYCARFRSCREAPLRRLIFVGAVSPSKGFDELMHLWSYLVDRGAEFGLAIAGGIGLHSTVGVGPLGVAEEQYERTRILPWLESLPDRRQPEFLGSLPPVLLKPEICKSTAVIVNPSIRTTETFCVSAVDAQACERPVFGVQAGALQETVYQGTVNTLASGDSIEEFGDLILDRMSDPAGLAEHGVEAGAFVRSNFAPEVVRAGWLRVLSGERVGPGKKRMGPRSLVYDAMRLTGAAMMARHVYDTLRGRKGG